MTLSPQAKELLKKGLKRAGESLASSLALVVVGPLAIVLLGAVVVAGSVHIGLAMRTFEVERFKVDDVVSPWYSTACVKFAHEVTRADLLDIKHFTHPDGSRKDVANVGDKGENGCDPDYFAIDIFDLAYKN